MVSFDRKAEGREVSPTVGILDSQSIKTSETGGTKGYDAGKKINALKRRLLVDVVGRLLLGCLSPADRRDVRVAP